MYVGQDVQRADAPAKITGTAIYAGDTRVAGAVSAVLVQSTIAAGRIAGFDLEQARTMPGVLAIITPDNAERLHIGKAARQTVVAPLLQNRDILYNGQHVAVVVADTLDHALAASARVHVRYDPGQAVTIMDPGHGQITKPKNFIKDDPDSRVGDPDTAFAAAPVRIEETFRTPVEHHNPMEPHATVARWEGGKLTVWTATQGISGAHETISSFFGLQPADVDIIGHYVGGGFGCKGNTWPPAVLACMAARAVNRPVKLVLTRQQMFNSNGYRPATIQRLKLGADRDGTLRAIRHDGLTQTSMPALGEFAEPVGVATRSMYVCDNFATSHRLVQVNQGLPTYMRAPGEASGMFALESAMDELAVALNMDPVALRLKNYADRDPSDHLPIASKALRACYEQGAAAFGWSRRTPEARSMRDGRMLVGQGMATSIYPTNRMPAAARVRLMPNGTALAQAGSQDLGTGTYTVGAQVVADALGLSMGRVRVQLGDSRFPKAPVSGGSMTTASVMPAMHQAAVAARARAFDMALAYQGNAWSGLSHADLRLDQGGVAGPRGRVELTDLLKSRGLPSIDGEAQAAPSDDAKSYSKHAYGAHFCEVRIDPDLGTIKVSRWVGAFDSGTIMNTRTARSQLIGGIIFGIGMALLEETRVDAASGRYTNANIAEYLLAVNADIPDIQTITVPSGDPVSDAFGAKGIGELPMVGAAPAVANAVWHATGRRVRHVPIRIEDVLA